MGTESTPDGAAYPPPLDRLLMLGRLYTRGREWRDYVAMGFTAEHVPELLRMSADPELNDADDPRSYAPLHAWRVLGQLAAPEAAAPLAEVLVQQVDDDFANEELPEVLGMIGAAAVEPVTVLLADPAIEERTRISAAGTLEEIAKRHPELRDRCVEVLMRQLERYAEQPEGLNGFLVHHLVELGVVEAAPLMQEAFEADHVDVMMRGDWEDVQVDLGLLEERLTTPKPPPWSLLQARPMPRPPREISAGEKARKQRKAQKQAAKRRGKK